ncbi:MAG: DUF2189 domain-containing protein [Rhizobium rhizophilum]|uniref:DUF2189 domain-containing protein n=1 Tax=Rhizobium rhizophilum TaxID=1850373 RepID=UPI00391BA498
MSTFHVMTSATGNIERPEIRRIAVSDVFSALREGYEDFREKPSHYAFVALIYPIAGAMMIGWSAGVELLPMVYPLLTGFALLGPLLALGLMEISRRQELGQPANWSDVLSLRKSPSLPALLMMSAYLVTLFMVWLVMSRGLYLSMIGDYPGPGVFAFASGVFDHPNAWAFLFWSNGIGFLLALVALMISLVAFPMLLDRDCGAASAVGTSVRASLANPVPVAVWGLMVAGLLAIGMATLLVGLIVIVPVLGHATWHFYRRLVV